jgi:hypothetical protein
MRKSLAHLVCQGFLVFSSALVLVACHGGDDSAGSGPPPPTVVRHDAAPLVARFPLIVDPVSVAWVQWHDGGDPAQPESLDVEWVDAVIHLAPGATNAFLALYHPRDEGRRPAVQDILKSEVPDGPFLTGSALDGAFASFDSSSYAYLDRGRDVLVLQSTGVGG